MIPGMFGAPLKILAGYMPPQQSLDFDISKIVRDNSLSGPVTDMNDLCKTPKYSEFLSLPHGLKGYFDYDQADSCAQKTNKPIFIDFTGHGCVNCREMEATVWSDPRVLKILRNDYIIVTLYVDDKKDLKPNEWITSKYDGEVKKTIGKKFADFQIYFFNANAQPYYALIDPFVPLKEKKDVDKAKLTQPKAYDLNPDNFVNFLQAGIDEFKKRHPAK
jgi:thiol:disulfide interchange protein DsbD